VQSISLNEIAKVIAGQSPPSTTYNNIGAGLPFFQGKADFQEKYPIARSWCTSKKRKEALPGDILMSVRAPVGTVNICNQRAVIGRGLSSIRPFENIHGDYLYYFLKSNEEQIASLGTGSTFKAITQDTLKKIKVPLPFVNGNPDLDSQIKIATLLSRVEVLIATRKETLRLLDEFLKSTFLEMFGDPVRNEMGWEKDKAKKYADCIVPGRDKPKSFTGTTPWVTTSDLVNLGKTKESKKEIGLTDFEIAEVRARIIPANSVLITCVGDLGVSSVCARKIVVNQQLHTFQMKSGMNDLFFMHAISFQKAFMHRKASKTTLPYMNKSVCNSIPIIKPPSKLQNQFAAIVEKVEQIKNGLQQNLSELENLYGVLSQKAFKNELDLGNIPLEKIDSNVNAEVANTSVLPPVEISEVKLPQMIAITPIGSDHSQSYHEYGLPLIDSMEGENKAEEDERNIGITNPSIRKEYVSNLLSTYLSDQKGNHFSMDDFSSLIEEKLEEVSSEENQILMDAGDYDTIRNSLIHLLENGQIEQNFNETSNKVELKIK